MTRQKNNGWKDALVIQQPQRSNERIQTTGRRSSVNYWEASVNTKVRKSIMRERQKKRKTEERQRKCVSSSFSPKYLFSTRQKVFHSSCFAHFCPCLVFLNHPTSSFMTITADPWIGGRDKDRPSLPKLLALGLSMALKVFWGSKIFAAEFSQQRISS